MNFLSRYRAVLLDLNGTFMFGHDRLGPGEDFHATYAGLRGTRLDPEEVRQAVLSCGGSLARLYEDPARFDDFPSVAEALAAAARPARRRASFAGGGDRPTRAGPRARLPRRLPARAGRHAPAGRRL